MKVYNKEKTQILPEYDLTKGYLIEDTITINQPEIQAVEEQCHYETIKEYENGGKDVKKVVDVDDSVTVSIENPKAELIYTKAYNSRNRDFKVYPYPQLNNNLLPNYMNYYEKYKEIVSSRYQNLVWGVTGEWLYGNFK